MKSKLTHVTFTGADDTVSPSKLIAMTADWLTAGMQIEWGILIGSQSGHRMPSYEWIRELLDLARPKVKLSLHICGKHLRDIAEGRGMALLPKMVSFQRCQLNWHAEPRGDISSQIYRAFKQMEGAWTPEVIFQMDGVNDGLLRATALKIASGLFDLSHGAGVSPDQWPQMGDFADLRMGYAGGLGPDNLREELPKIAAAARGDFWIDMETKLFDGKRFSMSNCQDVMEIAHDFVRDNS